MEITPSPIDIESRFATVRLSSLKAPASAGLTLEVAGVRVRFGFHTSWAPAMLELCQKYWSRFLVDGPRADVGIVLSPAEGEFIRKENPAWNQPQPFQWKVEDRTGTWIFHRDFTCLVRGEHYHAWLPEPTENFTDALDNILALAVRAKAESRQAFQFHCAVVEHEGSAVVFYGPSGIGKSTLAKASLQWGYRVMASDQVYLRIQDGYLWTSACPTRNPDIPRTPENWATNPLPVKGLFALKRTGEFDVQRLDRAEMTRRFFAEIFRDETDADFTSALGFASDVAMLPSLNSMSLSYPLGFNFWPRLKELGYI